jgi:aspartyl-tRNA(Asn)/glutamyl-tRNA(Gln) amidotransferase subunit B
MVMYLGVSSGKMNEGAFRCDVNLSIRKHGETAFGTRTEMKNLNSFAFIAKAIESETARQIKVIESGGQVTQETRRWDAAKGVSAAMRSKEDAHDYRYFPDPDLMPIIIDDEMQASLRASMPLLPDDYIDQYTKQYGIKPEVADALVSDKAVAEYFESVVKEVKDADMLANFMMTEVKRLMASGEEESAIGMSVHQLASLINLASSEKINLSIAKKVADKIWNTDILPKDYIDSEDLWPIVDRTVLEAFADQVLTQNPRILSDYLGGKTQAFGAYMGQMMRLTKGKADPGVSEQIFMDRIQK